MTTLAVERPAPSVTSEDGTTSDAPARHSYGQILKSTAMIGGSSVVNIALGVVRMKASALFLGPAGVGLFGLYGSVIEVIQSLAGMGLQTSGVRQIADSVGSGDTERIARTVTVLRRMALVLGLLGAAVPIVFARPISHLTFGSYEYAGAVALLSVAVFAREVSGGQTALIQGMRRITELASISILGALFGTVITIPLIYVFRDRGIVPSLVCVGLVTLLASWWYSRRVVVRTPALTVSQVASESGELLKLGFVFMASGFLTMGAAYAIRIIVVRVAGIDAAGLYQSAWTLGGLYAGFILQAMGADFYPRLTAVARNHPECNRLVNEQAQVSLLLAGPGVLASLTLAPLVIAVFYSPKFAAAAIILRWVSVGMLLRIIAWPMGFIVVAKGARTIFLLVEIAATVVHVGLGWLLVSRFGVAGAGMAFAGLYVWHGLLVYVIVTRLSGFRWSAANLKMGMMYLPLTIIVFGASYVLPMWLAAVLGVAAVVGTGIHSARMLVRLVPLNRMPKPLVRVLKTLGLHPIEYTAPVGEN